MNKIYYIETAEFNSFLNCLRDNYNVFIPVIKDESSREADYFYKNLSSNEPFLFNPYRAIEPLKSFFTSPKERVSGYFMVQESIKHFPIPLRKSLKVIADHAYGGSRQRREGDFLDQDEVVLDSASAVIFGVKSCDIAAHRIQDYVFLEGVKVDTLYRLRRENTILISGDCTAFKEVCFCLSMDILPHPTAGFDLNLSPLNDGYLVEVGSQKGEGLIEGQKQYFKLAKDVQVSARKTKRDNLIQRLKQHLFPQDIPAKDSLQQLVKQGYALDTWQQFMLTCVECGGCNLICDTCHCFLLSDQKENSHNAKIRAWDSCLYQSYALVAGGANPLKTRTKRLRNRFMKKFDFFIENLGIPACCGCGRCIEVCPGKIDIREVLKDLAKKLGNNQ